MARAGGKDRGLFERPAGSGIWWVCLWEDGRRIVRKVGSKASARQVYERLKTEAREGRLVPKKKVKIVPTVAEVLDDRIEGFTGRDLKNEKRIAQWWKELWGSRRIDELSPEDFRKLQSRLVAEEKWSQKTINNVFVTLKAALN